MGKPNRVGAPLPGGRGVGAAYRASHLPTCSHPLAARRTSVTRRNGDPVLRVPLTLGDFFVDRDDPRAFWQVLPLGVQNLYDPELESG